MEKEVLFIIEKYWGDFKSSARNFKLEAKVHLSAEISKIFGVFLDF